MLNSQGFDLWADNYDESVNASDENNEYPFAGYKELMNFIYGAVMEKRPAKVLDIGIGTGTIACKLYETGNEITGIDFSGEMLNQARAKMPDATLIQHDFTKGLPDAPGSVKYDFIISTYAFHHMTDEAKIDFLRILLDYINDTGTILIGDVGFQSRGDLETCKKTYSDQWDEDEFYFVFTELQDKLNSHCAISFHKISHCSGIMEIRHLRAL